MDALLFRTIGLLGLAIVVALLARRLRLPYTVGLVLAGGALAAARIDLGVELTHDLVFDLVLPPLLFEAAINLNWRELKRDLPPVLLLSTVGVALSALVVAVGLARFAGWGIAPAAIFGALIAATDPIAIVALLRETGVGGRLRLLIESESLINDGAAAVLFALVLAYFANAGAGESAGAVALAFASIAGGGLAIGLAVGFVAIGLAGRTDDHLVETALTAVAAYGSFLIAEHVGASGVLAGVAAGMTMGNLGVLGAADGNPFSLTARGRDFVLAFWEFAAFLANSLVFLLIGSALAKVHFADFGLGRLALVIGLTLVGRMIAVYPLSLVLARSRWAIPLRQQHLLWWGGLRGALALALVLALPATTPGRDDILFAAFATVAFSSLVQGLTAPLALRWLGLAKSGEA